MKILRRSLSLLCALVLLLSVSVCSVSAGSTAMDWMDTPPYTDDFLRPADSTSVVYEFWVANGYRHRVVFPAGSTVMGGMTYDKEMTFFWTATSVNDVAIVYREKSDGTFSSDYVFVLKPTPQGTGYSGTWTSYSGIVGYVTNNQLLSGDGVVPQNGKQLPFPNSQLQEEKKTQSMISQLIQNIKDWFSNLIESMGNFFTELGNKISSGFTALGDKIKGFFTQLVEDIKGLFVPSDGFFDEYSNNFELWAREHFGFLFETLEIVDTAINKYVSFSPSDDFVVTLPEASFTVKDKNYVLWEQQTFSVNSLLTSIPALSMFHTVYFTFVYALFFYLLYRLGEKAYTDIFGGSD